MTAASPFVYKEVRELLPWWFAAALGLAACGLIGSGLPPRFPTQSLEMVAYVIYAAGCNVLGALSVGQEYAHRTLDGLLAQPVSRRRIFATKLAVLVPLVAGLLLANVVAPARKRR